MDHGRAGPPTRASPGRHRRPQVSRARATRHRRYGHRLSRGAPPHGSHLCVEGAVAGPGRDARGPAALRGRGPGHWCAAPSQRGRRRGLRIRGHGLGQVPVSRDGAARGLSPQSHPGRRRRTAVAVGHVRAGADLSRGRRRARRRHRARRPEAGERVVDAEDGGRLRREGARLRSGARGCGRCRPLSPSGTPLRPLTASTPRSCPGRPPLRSIGRRR